MLCGVEDYPYNLSINCGKRGESKVPLESDHVLYNNFFTSHTLLTKLVEMGIRT